jgi:hypothetical protein
MKLSRHAGERWKQRFPRQIADDVYADAVFIAKRSKVAKSTAAQMSLKNRRAVSEGHAQLRFNKKVGAVFVCVPFDYVITVFRYGSY